MGAAEDERVRAPAADLVDNRTEDRLGRGPCRLSRLDDVDELGDGEPEHANARVGLLDGVDVLLAGPRALGADHRDASVAASTSRPPAHRGR